MLYHYKGNIFRNEKEVYQQVLMCYSIVYRLCGRSSRFGNTHLTPLCACFCLMPQNKLTFPQIPLPMARLTNVSLSLSFPPLSKTLLKYEFVVISLLFVCQWLTPVVASVLNRCRCTDHLLIPLTDCWSLGDTTHVFVCEQVWKIHQYQLNNLDFFRNSNQKCFSF